MLRAWTAARAIALDAECVVQIVVTEEGELALDRATPERFEEIVRFPVIEGRTWNHPALSGGYLVVRNGNEMAAFDLRPPVR